MCGLLLQVSGVQRLIILPIRASIATATAVVVFRTSDSMASMTVSAIAVLALFGAVANARVIPPGQGMRARLSDKSILFFSARHDRPYAPDLSLSLSLTHTHTTRKEEKKNSQLSRPFFACPIQTGSCVGNCYAPFDGNDVFCQCKDLKLFFIFLCQTECRLSWLYGLFPKRNDFSPRACDRTGNLACVSFPDVVALVHLVLAILSQTLQFPNRDFCVLLCSHGEYSNPSAALISSPTVTTLLLELPTSSSPSWLTQTRQTLHDMSRCSTPSASR